MGKSRTSPIWKISTEKLTEVTKNSNSLADILRYFGMFAMGGHYKTLRKRLKRDNIDLSHMRLGKGANKGRKFNPEMKPLDEVMVENSSYSRSSLKKRLLKENILENVCSEEEFACLVLVH